jgi:hypothetical protein
MCGYGRVFRVATSEVSERLLGVFLVAVRRAGGAREILVSYSLVVVAP